MVEVLLRRTFSHFKHGCAFLGDGSINPMKAGIKTALIATAWAIVALDADAPQPRHDADPRRFCCRTISLAGR